MKSPLRLQDYQRIRDLNKLGASNKEIGRITKRHINTVRRVIKSTSYLTYKTQMNMYSHKSRNQTKLLNPAVAHFFDKPKPITLLDIHQQLKEIRSLLENRQIDEPISKVRKLLRRK
jgi:transposase